ncbi:hypothetical protein OSTOST_02996 [Ostertagia ostertagi]
MLLVANLSPVFGFVGELSTSIEWALNTGALKHLTDHGIITATELSQSEDAHVLSQAHPHDRLTFHSLANVIRNIFKERPENMKSKLNVMKSVFFTVRTSLL